MRVLDATYLIDYLNGAQAAKTYYEVSGASDELWVVPSPVHAEVLVGLGNYPDTSVEQGIEALSWTEVYDIDVELAVEAGRIAESIGPEGPYLDGVDALVAAVARKLNAPLVSSDSDLTHEKTKEVVTVEEYRQ